MRIRCFSSWSGSLSGLFFLFIVGCLLCWPEPSFAQQNNDCHTCTDGKADLPDSQKIMRANARRSSRVPLNRSRTGPSMKRRTLIPFIMNEPRGPLSPSDRDRFYGIGALEVGVNLGAAHVLTDVSGKPGANFPSLENFLISNASFAGGLFARYRINEWVGFSFGADLARLNASNDLGYTYRYIVRRDANMVETPDSLNVYSFTNDIAEFSGKLELHSPPLGRSSWSFYGFAGFAAFYSKPQMYDNMNMAIETTPMEIVTASGTVTPDPPSSLSFALPLGGGATVMLANFVRVGFEIGYRYTGNHGIDGAYVMNTAYDSYMFSTIRIGYVFPMLK